MTATMVYHYGIYALLSMNMTDQIVIGKNLMTRDMRSIKVLNYYSRKARFVHKKKTDGLKSGTGTII